MTAATRSGRHAARGRRRLDRRRITMIVVGLVALLAAAAVVVVPRLHGDQAADVADARLPIGVPINPAELDRSGLARALDLAKRAGARMVSAGAPWWYVSRNRPDGPYGWSALDRLVDAARERGLQVRLQLTGTPDAVHPHVVRTVPDRATRIWYPPRTPVQLRAWGRFVHDTVAHFTPHVSSFEIWNEPNIDTFWKPAPAPDEYARLLEESYRNAKQAAPSAQVVFGGLSHNDLGYLQRYYSEARRLFPDAADHRNFFDVLGVHPYTADRCPDETSPATFRQGRFGPVDQSFYGLRLMKDVMDRNDHAGADKQILVGEYGFSTGRSTNGPPVPDRRRAYYLKRALALAGEMPFLAGLIWYAFLPDSDTSKRWAVATADGPPSWTYLALQDVAARRAPAIHLPSPTAIRPDGQPITPALAGVDPRDVIHTELYVDGVLVAEADGVTVQWTRSPRRRGEGRAQLVVYTRDRHAWPSDTVTLPPGTRPTTSPPP